MDFGGGVGGVGCLRKLKRIKRLRKMSFGIFFYFWVNKNYFLVFGYVYYCREFVWCVLVYRWGKVVINSLWVFFVISDIGVFY